MHKNKNHYMLIYSEQNKLIRENLAYLLNDKTNCNNNNIIIIITNIKMLFNQCMIILTFICF